MQNVWTVPADLLVALPSDMPMQRAALVEPTAVAVHDVGRAELRGAEHAIVIGGGPIGVLIALVARSAGARIMVAEPNPRRRGLATELGLAVIDPTTTDVPAAVADWTAGAGADVAFEVSGAADGVKAAVDVLSTRGRLVLVAIHDKPRQLDLFRFFWRELTLVGARVYTRDDFVTAVDLVSTESAVEKLISDVVPLADAMRAFERLAQGDGAMKVLIDCQATTS
jgi:2-desacetyl-2-hydroxyethyl bacteriochlorophyllide A dehydrogenase